MEGVKKKETGLMTLVRLVKVRMPLL
jgi:hypothetical protein